MSRTMSVALVLLACAALLGCSPAMLGALGAGMNAAAAGSGQTGALFLFGGQGHKTFLGCSKCSKYDQKSVLISYGSFGSPYSATSIFNGYGTFGSAYSAYSPCNPYASDPPVIVDNSERFYGRLSLNQYRRDADKAPGLVAWLGAVCKH